ncbi:MAG: PAS domain S-box protein [Desulfobulbaceae bacterium]|nr:PAS domain S-box protein [Desulfobulbaceae bacterium]
MRKEIIFVLCLWAIVVGCALFWNVYDQKQAKNLIAFQTARAFFDQIVITRSWNARHGGVYVPVNEHTQPNTYLEDQFRDLTTAQNVSLTKINPAFMTRQISEMSFESKLGVRFHITSLNPIRPGNEALDWEKNWLQSFERGKTERGKFLTVGSESFFRYMAPLSVTDNCLKCHAKQGYKKGDIRGGISVTLPYFSQDTNMTLVISYGIAALFGALFILVGGRLLNRQRMESLENEERYKALHNASFGGIIILDQGTILDCNQGLADMTGFSKAELVGMNGLKLIAESWIDHVEQNIKRGYDQHYEVEGIRKDGSTYPLAIRGKTTLYKGQEVRVTEFRDISEIKKAEEAYRSSEIKYRELFDQSPLGLALCTMDGQFVSVNPAYAQIIGYSVDETLKLTYSEITPEKYSANEQIQLEQLRINGRFEPYEKEYMHKDGHLVPVRHNGMVVTRDNMELIWSSVEDITLQKQAEKEKEKLVTQLRQAQKMEAVGTMAGGIAHDFNNMLSVILGNADMALDTISDGNPGKYNVEQIVKASRRVKDLIKQILTFSRQTEQALLPVEPYPVIKESLKLLRSTIPTTVNIVQNMSNDSCTILADSTQIHQMFMNLCMNAVHAMDEKGTLEISGATVNLEADDIVVQPNTPPGQYFKLSVSDTGAGMNKQTLERIFDPFYTTKKTGEGTGMGLSIVLGIIKSYGGFILVNSELRKGTMFTLYFPVTEKKISQSIKEKLQECPKGNERILFVDDEKMLAEIGGRMLSRLGYDVTVKVSSNEALEIFTSAPEAFDLVITDQTMPNMSGGELAIELLKSRPDIPIILCTGYSKKISKEEAKKFGVREYLLKPLERKQLAKVIREVLE